MDIFREYWNQNATFYKSVWRKILVQSANSKRTVRYMGIDYDVHIVELFSQPTTPPPPCNEMCANSHT